MSARRSLAAAQKTCTWLLDGAAHESESSPRTTTNLILFRAEFVDAVGDCSTMDNSSLYHVVAVVGITCSTGMHWLGQSKQSAQRTTVLWKETWPVLFVAFAPMLVDLCHGTIDGNGGLGVGGRRGHRLSMVLYQSKHNAGMGGVEINRIMFCGTVSQQATYVCGIK